MTSTIARLHQAQGKNNTWIWDGTSLAISYFLEDSHHRFVVAVSLGLKISEI